MNVVYSASDLYSSLAGISLTSLLDNNQSEEEIHVVFMDNGISEDNKNKLQKTVTRYGRDILFVPLAEALNGIDINLQKWNISTFGRLFEATALPGFDKVIHIDCDTVVCGSLKEIWSVDMRDYVFAGASDCLSDRYKTNIGLNPEDLYINAGVLLLNLERIRNLKLEEKFLSYIETNSAFLTYVDQEVLNACVPSSEKLCLSLKFNSYSILHYLTYKQLIKLRHAKHVFTEREYSEAKDNPLVLHYTGCFLEGTRPWIEGDCHPKKESFETYQAISEWKGMSKWDDNRSKKQKAITYIANALPKPILTALIGLIHGVIVPRINKLKQGRHTNGY